MSLNLNKTIKVVAAIPSMGYCHAEAYCNRLVNWMHLGHLEEQQKCVHALMDVLQEEKDDELKRRILTGFLSRNPLYYELPEGRRFEFHFAVIGRIFTPFAREQAAKMALEKEADYLYMVDDDMICPDDLFEALYRHNVDIVAPLAFTRNYPHKPVIYAEVSGIDPISKTPYFYNNVIWNYPKNKLVECDAVGFGAVLIKMDVIRKMKAPYFMSTNSSGEDILFCYNAKKVGARVFMDTETGLGHLGSPINVTPEYVDELRKRETPDFEKIHPIYDKYEDRKSNGHPEAVFITGEK